MSLVLPNSNMKSYVLRGNFRKYELTSACFWGEWERLKLIFLHITLKTDNCARLKVCNICISQVERESRGYPQP